jgi:hypothetical protein
MRNISTLTTEQSDLLETLAKHRSFLRFTARGLTDEQLRERTTVSELCIGGLLKHVASVEQGWTAFIVDGPSAHGSFDEASIAAHSEGFRLRAGDTAASLLAVYDSVAKATDKVVAGLPNLDLAHPLPEAPWFEAGARWSARRVVLHIIAETAQHAGHADIIREAIDGAKTMG